MRSLAVPSSPRSRPHLLLFSHNKQKMRVFATALALACAAADPVGPTLPWGIHIASGSEPQSSMTIMWSTRAHVAASVVTYNPAGGAPLSASGEQWLFSDVGNTQTLHRVLLENLLPGTSYSYSVGDGASATSPLFNFSTAPASGWSPTIAVYGDMGISTNALSTMPLLLRDVEDGALDVIVHIGDAAYDLQSNNGATGDAFMVQIQEVATKVPCEFAPHVREGGGKGLAAP